MSGKTMYLPVLISIAIILTGMTLVGCSTGAATQQDSSGQAVTSPASPFSKPAQTGTGNPGGAPSGRPGGPDMSKMMGRAAEILGITEAKFTSAFQQAQESVFGNMPGGTPGILPPAPPSGTSGQQPQPPSGITGLPAPQGGQGPGSESVQKVYNKMAEILSISADRIASAIEQARQELQPPVK